MGDGIEVDFVTSNEFEKLNLLAASPGVTVDSLWQLYSNGRYENAARTMTSRNTKSIVFLTGNAAVVNSSTWYNTKATLC